MKPLVRVRIGPGLLLAALAGCLALTGCSAPASTPTDSLGERLDDAVQRYVDLDRFTGAILVARGDEILLSGGYGEAQREFDVPVTTRTRFDIGSLAKPFTAAAILRLAADGRLVLDDPIVQYLPEYPRPQGEKVTIHHLLTHTSGIPSLGRRDGIPDAEIGADLYEPIALDDLLAVFAGGDLQFEPGSDYRYNNSAYAVAAAIVEAVAGMPFADYLRTAILEPAGMHDTGVFPGTEVVERMATGYVGYEPAVNRPLAAHPSWGIGAGSMYSTVEDLRRWNRALDDDTVLPDAQREVFFQAHVDRERYDYGYGWFLENIHDRPVVGHGGTTVGFVTAFFRFPQDDLLVVALTNLQPELGVDVPDHLGRQLSALVLGLEPDLPPRVVDPEPDALFRLAGTYALDADHRIRVLSDGKKGGEKGRLRARAEASEGSGDWSLMTYSRQRDLDASDPSVRQAGEFLRALLAGEEDGFRAELRPDRRGEIEAGYASAFSRRMRRQWGKIESVTAYFLDASPNEAIVMTRVQAERGAFYLHAEITPGEGVFGWYLDETLPAEVVLLPTSDTTFFVDAFPHRGPMDPSMLPVSFRSADGRVGSMSITFREEALVARRVGD